MDKVVVYAATRNLYTALQGSIKSLMWHNPDIDRIYCLIEDDELPYKYPTYIHCINVSQQTWFNFDNPNVQSQWTYMILLRVVLDQILDQEDQVLVLDVDTIIRGRLDWFFQPLKESIWCGGCVYDSARLAMFNIPNLIGPMRIHAAAMNLNLKAWRVNHVSETCLELLQTNTYTFPEEDVISLVAQDHMLCVPNEIHDISFPTADRIIYHFGQTNWRDQEVENFYDLPMFQQWIHLPWYYKSAPLV